jgi:hypothetical protein
MSEQLKILTYVEAEKIADEFMKGIVDNLNELFDGACRSKRGMTDQEDSDVHISGLDYTVEYEGCVILAFHFKSFTTDKLIVHVSSYTSPLDSGYRVSKRDMPYYFYDTWVERFCFEKFLKKLKKEKIGRKERDVKEESRRMKKIEAYCKELSSRKAFETFILEELDTKPLVLGKSRIKLDT